MLEYRFITPDDPQAGDAGADFRSVMVHRGQDPSAARVQRVY
jgi:hypothetical protein